MAYSVPPLPYAYDALEPHIDKATMEFHHDKHHQAYVDKANAALEGTEWADKPVEEVLQNLDSLGDKKAEVAGTRIPDFVKLAEAYGCIGLRCEKKEDVDAVIEQAMAINDQPVVIDFIVHKDAMVWPMVAAGTSNDDIKFARGMAPDWDGDME